MHFFLVVTEHVLLYSGNPVPPEYIVMQPVASLQAVPLVVADLHMLMEIGNNFKDVTSFWLTRVTPTLSRRDSLRSGEV